MDIYNKLKERFGNIFLITLSNRKDRHDHIFRQLEILGMKNENDVHTIYATPFPFNNIIMEAFNNSGKGRFTKPNEYDCARNHYSIVKQSYDLGYDYCLVLEDDLLFYNSDNVWNDYINNIPNDFDVIQFGGFTADPNIDKYLGIDKGYWVKHKDVGLWTTSMYALSRKGMEYYLAFMNKLFWVADGPLYKAPINDKLVNAYMSTIPLVVQADKDVIVSDIRDEINDTIDYKNQNLYEKYCKLDDYVRP